MCNKSIANQFSCIQVITAAPCTKSCIFTDPGQISFYVQPSIDAADFPRLWPGLQLSGFFFKKKIGFYLSNNYLIAIILLSVFRRHDKIFNSAMKNYTTTTENPVIRIRPVCQLIY